MRFNLGRFGRVREDGAGWLLGPGCIRLRPAAGADPNYLTHYLGNPTAHEWLRQNAGGSVIAHVTKTTLGRLPVVLPPLLVQEQIAAVLDAVEEQIAGQEQLAAATRSLRDLLLPFLTAESPAR